MMKGKRLYGERGENYAENLLLSKGYKIIEKNYKNKIGEIDIIAIDKDTLVFVEVKARWSTKYGKPEEAVGTKKLEKIKKVSEFFLLTHNNLPKKQRIDVVAIEVQKNNLISSKIIKTV